MGATSTGRASRTEREPSNSRARGRTCSPHVAVEDREHVLAGDRAEADDPAAVALLAHGHRQAELLDLALDHLGALVADRARVEDVDPERLLLGGPDREAVRPGRLPGRRGGGGSDLGRRGAERAAAVGEGLLGLAPGPRHGDELWQCKKGNRPLSCIVELFYNLRIAASALHP